MAAAAASTTPTYIKADSRIDSVTVYESSAQIHRVAKIVPTALGDNIVQFRDLPDDLGRDSLQVAIAAGDDETVQVKLSGITFDTVREPRTEAASDYSKRQESREKLRELNIKKQSLADDIDALKGQMEFRGKLFDRSMQGYEEDTPAAVGDIDMWKKLMSSTLDNRQQLTARLRAVEDELEALELERAALAEFADSSYDTYIKYSVVRVHLHVAGAALPPSILLQLSYVVTNNAKWEAAYDLRVDSATDSVSLSYNAIVQQSTTQPWNNVRVTLSTARSAVKGNPPELVPWRARLVSIPDSAHTTSRRRAGTVSGSDEEESVAPGGGGGGGGGTEMEQPVQVSSTVEEGATSVSFTVPGEHIIANDNQPLRVTLATVPLKVDFSYLTRPKLLDSAFAQIKATNLSTFTMVDGSVTVFVDHQYISKSRLSRVAPRGTFKLSLGVDSGISVKYKNVSSIKSEEGGVFSATKSKTVYKETATVKNLKSQAVVLAVERALPVPNDSSISVELLEPRYEKDSASLKKTDESIIVSTVTLQPLQEVVLPFTFSVTHPIGETLTGI